MSRSNTLSKPTTVARSNTAAAAPDRTRSNSLSGPDRSKGLASLSRGPSTKRAPASLENPPIPEHPSNDKGKINLCLRSGHLFTQPANRVSEFYENYLDQYDGSGSSGPGPALAPIRPLNPAPSKARSQRLSTMSRNSVGSMKRRSTAKRSTRSNPKPVEEEEEGYGSGDYEEVSFEIQKIRVKVRQ